MVWDRRAMHIALRGHKKAYQFQSKEDRKDVFGILYLS